MLHNAQATSRAPLANQPSHRARTACGSVAKLEQSAGRLRALSPKATLERGYAIVRAGDEIVRSGRAVEPGARVEVELAEGGFGARVEDTK